ncbi:rhodanese-like domain-containing protein [Exilibacterium tricleocarpae]|uniref:rhodanese-like domain-containing protein n=1 Tax=Exilibacterium tricleocarpae TaxID=2591008 RepID=UPI001FE9E8D6|nr:rhodanese-like domain-containing protein [Exilibacterium tricleocarpae]
MEFFVFISEQWLLVSVLLVLIYVFTWREKQKGGKGVSAQEATRMLNSDSAVLVDVREAADFKAGHIVDAVNIPHNKLAERFVELEPHREKVVVLVDKMGQHVGNAGRALREKGFDVRRLDGGMAEWQNQNLPVVKK